MATITLSADHRNALFGQVSADIFGINDLVLAIEQKDHEAADRLGRRIAGDLRLIEGGLGWADEISEPIEISMPADELRTILTDLKERAFGQYESAKGEQEAFRAPWERAALVRDVCADALARLPKQ